VGKLLVNPPRIFSIVLQPPGRPYNAESRRCPEITIQSCWDSWGCKVTVFLHFKRLEFGNRKTGLARNYFCFSAGFQKLTAKDATDKKHHQNRCLRYPNPMEDVPDQDSAQIPGKQFKNIFFLPEQDRWNLGTLLVSTMCSPTPPSIIQGIVSIQLWAVQAWKVDPLGNAYWQ